MMTVIGVFWCRTWRWRCSIRASGLAGARPNERPSGRAPGHRNDHYVNAADFDPNVVEKLTPEQEKYYLASQWQMMWWKLKRHKLAVICGSSCC